MTSPSRWFDPQEIRLAIPELVGDPSRFPPAECDELKESRKQKRLRYTVIAMGGMAVALMVMMGALFMFAEPRARLQQCCRDGDRAGGRLRRGDVGDVRRGKRPTCPSRRGVRGDRSPA